MKILAFDTASKNCSVALADDNSVIGELSLNHGDTHSKYLIRMIQCLFDFSKLSINDIDGFGITIGPGSFTGLRIGLSTLKGLALVTDKPVAAIPTLKALAYQFSFSEKLICPMLDARRNQVYTALYRFDRHDCHELIEPEACSIEKVLERINEPCIFVGDGAVLYKSVISNSVGEYAVYATPGQHMISASVIACMALNCFMNSTSEISEIKGLVPLYIRKSDAERSILQ